MEGKIAPEILHRMAYNAKLYANKASASAGGTLWIYGALGLRVASSDDFVILVDSAMEVDGYSGTPEYWEVVYDDLVALEKLLREHDEPFDLADFPGELRALEETHLPELREMEQMVFDIEHWETTHFSAFAVRADRLQKMSLIKPQGGAIDMKGFMTPDGDLAVGWKAGANCRGLIAPLDREAVADVDPEGLWDA